MGRMEFASWIFIQIESRCRIEKIHITYDRLRRSLFDPERDCFSLEIRLLKFAPEFRLRTRRRRCRGRSKSCARRRARSSLSSAPPWSSSPTDRDDPTSVELQSSRPGAGTSGAVTQQLRRGDGSARHHTDRCERNRGRRASPRSGTRRACRPVVVGEVRPWLRAGMSGSTFEVDLLDTSSGLRWSEFPGVLVPWPSSIPGPPPPLPRP